MFPRIAIVDSVEMIRDGGSLAAIFHGNDSCEYWLFFKILIREIDDRTAERSGYAAPVIINRHTGIEVLVSWAQASTLLRQVGTMTRQDRHLNYCGTMQRIAAAKGALPDEIDKLMSRIGSVPSAQFDEGR